MRSNFAGSMLTCALSFLGAAQATRADNFTFNYSGLSNNASDTTIQTYMQTKLGAGQTVTVTGAIGSNNYNGDGHVVGACSPTCSSYTLANMDGGTFIKNDTSLNPASSDILMKFTGLTAATYTVSFDLEIFPDASCQSGTSCGANQPDLSFDANGVLVHDWVAAPPAVPGYTYTHSPASGSGTTELTPQFIGSSGSFTITGPLTSLDFIDWPATIAINNLKITSTPEPATLLFLGTLIAGLVFRKLKKRTA